MMKLCNVSARYNLLTHYLNVVNHVDFTIKDNEIFGIAGESGCGKSTLLKVMYDLLEYPLEISSGKVELYGRDANGQQKILESGEIKNARWKDISYVPQGAMHVLNPVRKIDTQFYDAIGKHHKHLNKKDLHKEIISYLQEMELPSDVMNAYPHQLSGGMKQRILIALATFLHPSIVLADEPTTALDVVVQRGILTMLSRLQKKTSNSIVIVSHDMGVHYQITDRLGIMYAGEMIEAGPTDSLFDKACHPYTQMLISALPKIGDTGQKVGISGAPPSLQNPPPGCRFAPRCKYATDLCKEKAPLRYAISEDHQASCHLLDGKYPSYQSPEIQLKEGDKDE